jgi:hypothetical protein
MDRYVRVEQRKTEQPSIQENEVRIMAAGKMRNYISYATTLLTVRQPPNSTLYGHFTVGTSCKMHLRARAPDAERCESTCRTKDTVLWS